MRDGHFSPDAQMSTEPTAPRRMLANNCWSITTRSYFVGFNQHPLSYLTFSLWVNHSSEKHTVLYLSHSLWPAQSWHFRPTCIVCSAQFRISLISALSSRAEHRPSHATAIHQKKKRPPLPARARVYSSPPTTAQDVRAAAPWVKRTGRGSRL